MAIVKCSNCGEEGHVGWNCPRPHRAKGGDVQSPALQVSPECRTLISEPAPVAKAAGAKFDRNEYHRNYMREYMRKRRAAAKKA